MRRGSAVSCPLGREAFCGGCPGWLRAVGVRIRQSWVGERGDGRCPGVVLAACDVVKGPIPPPESGLAPRADVTDRLQTLGRRCRSFDLVADRQELYARRRHRREFGDRVRELRQAREWTQEQLAESSGLDRSYIAGIETGARNASLDVIVKLASGLGVTPAELFEGMA